MPAITVLDTVLNSPKMEKSKVVRCLFGRPDHQNVREDLDSEMAKLRQEDLIYFNKRYNFNTDKDEPLEGRFEWTLVTQTDDVPSFYRKGYRSKHRTITRRELSSISGLKTAEISSSPVIMTVGGETLCNISSSAVKEDLQKQLETTPVSRDSSFSSETTSPESDSSCSSNSSGGNLVQTRMEDFLKVRKRRLDLDDDQVRPAKSPRVDFW